MMTSSTAQPLIVSFVAGAATAWIAKILLDRKKEGQARTNGASEFGTHSHRWRFNSCFTHFLVSFTCLYRSLAGATLEGNDLSLFYGDIKDLTTITNERRFLPKEVYGTMVLDAVVCCVDILAVRVGANGKKECLLVERGSEPVKGVWWLPGESVGLCAF